MNAPATWTGITGEGGVGAEPDAAGVGVVDGVVGVDGVDGVIGDASVVFATWPDVAAADGSGLPPQPARTVSNNTVREFMRAS